MGFPSEARLTAAPRNPSSIIVIVALTFIGGLLSGAEAAADGCGKVIGFIVVAALIIAWILGLL